jgi:hypothetical protein
MCSTTGPKIFGPPTGVVSGGTFAPPTNYASNAQPTANVGAPPGAPPAPVIPPTPIPSLPPGGMLPQNNLKAISKNPFNSIWGGGSGAGRGGPVGRMYNSAG